MIGQRRDLGMVRLGASVLEAIREHASAAMPDECCGALLGDAARGVVRAQPVPNEALRPRGRYVIGPEWVRRVEAEAAAEGLDVIGFYHSHPARPSSPSLLDLEAAWPWYIYLIVGTDGARAWRLREDRFDFDEIRLVPHESYA